MAPRAAQWEAMYSSDALAERPSTVRALGAWEAMSARMVHDD